MLINFSSPQFIFLGTFVLLASGVISAILHAKKLSVVVSRVFHHSPASAEGGPAPARTWTKDDLLPPLIDSPVNLPTPSSPAETTFDEEDFDIDLIPDDGYMTLLRGAESVVERIQLVVDQQHVTPANPDLVCENISDILRQYSIFLDTEYFDAINSFIQMTVQRDCDLLLTEGDIKLLWGRQAA